MSGWVSKPRPQAGPSEWVSKARPGNQVVLNPGNWVGLDGGNRAAKPGRDWRPGPSGMKIARLDFDDE